ncbi:MAG: hypothetical protein ACRC7G_16675 [Beijerinckiaceae bacterium]
MTQQKPDSEKRPHPEEQPEALATFAASARQDGKKPDAIGLAARSGTAPVPTNPDDKADAATKVLREGVLDRDEGAAAAIRKLPDRTRTAQN